MDALPLAGLEPPQPPLASHEVALVELHVNWLVPPADTEAGLAASCTLGAATMFTVVESEVVPPIPVQLRLNAVGEERGPTDSLPRVVFVPVHGPPAATQEVAPVLVHASEVRPLSATSVGDADNVIVGGSAGAATETTTVATVAPFGPAQLREYSVAVASGPIVALPPVGLEPDQPPPASHEVALVEVHVNWLVPPAGTDNGLAVRTTSVLARVSLYAGLYRKTSPENGSMTPR